jgi:hypothetical protein
LYGRVIWGIIKNDLCRLADWAKFKKMRFSTYKWKSAALKFKKKINSTTTEGGDLLLQMLILKGKGVFR